MGATTQNALASLRRIASGVAALLGLEDRGELLKHVAEFLPPVLLRNATLRELLPALRGAVSRVATELFKTDMWDGRASPYRYATAIAAWLFLYSEYCDAYIRGNCPLFSDRVASEVLRFLATRRASCIADALAEELLDVDPRELGQLCVKAN
jgi:hypothetical protein